MKKLTQLAVAVAALAIFATGFQAKSAQVSVAGGGGSTGGGGSGGEARVALVSVTPALTDYGTAFAPAIGVTVSGGASDPIPTGTVTFKMVNIDGGSQPVPSDSDVPLAANSSGTGAEASWDMDFDGNPVIPVGLYNAFGNYSGDGNYNGSIGNKEVNVNMASSTITMTGCPSSAVKAGDSISFDVSVTWLHTPTETLGAVTAPTGIVTLTDSPSSISGSTTFEGALTTHFVEPSTVTISVTPTVTGVNAIKPSYPGDSNYLDTSGNPCAITVN